LRDAQPTLADKAPGSGLEGAIFQGLETLTDNILDREWTRDGGGTMRISRCLIDANWGASTDVVYQFCRQSTYGAILMPSHGKFVGAASIPFAEYRRQQGDRQGHHWRIPSIAGKRVVRHVIIDTNYWKSFLFARLAVNIGDRGCLSLFGTNPDHHRLLAEHLTAEYPVTTSGRGRTLEEWKQRPNHPDNHWFDCLVGCAAGASMQGVELKSVSADPKKQRLSLADMARRPTARELAQTSWFKEQKKVRYF
jgi:phage terminase large subunit GpA-like protein